MKKVYLLLACCITLVLCTRAQWIPSGAKVVTTDTVGIGTVSPVYKLDVNGSLGSRGYTILTNTLDSTGGNVSIGSGYWFPNVKLGVYSNQLYGVRIFDTAAFRKGGAALDVEGKLKVADGSQGIGKILTSDGNGFASWQAPIANVWTASGNNIYNSNTGLVGIGSNAPVYKLDVNGTFGARGNTVLTTTVDSTGGNVSVGSGTVFGNIKLGVYSNQLYGARIYDTAAKRKGGASLDVEGNLKVADGTQAAGKVLTSDANGFASWQAPVIPATGWTVSGNNVYSGSTTKVGIGLSAPVTQFANTAVNIYGTDGLGISTSSIAWTSQGFGYAAAISNLGSTSWDGGLVIKTNSASAHLLDMSAGTNSNPVLVALGNGNVGIGTKAPATPLEVDMANGRFQLDPYSAYQNTVLMGNFTGKGHYAPQLRFTSDSVSNNIDIGQDSAGNFVVQGNDITRLAVTNAGRVGIGTTAPVYSLDLNGTFGARGNTVLTTTTDSTGGNVSVGSGAVFTNTKLGVYSNQLYGVRIYDTAAKRKGGAGLDVEGNLKVADGTQATGRVLTSDANGFASWQAPAASGWAASGNNIYNSNSGFVGIGTSGPDKPLVVRGGGVSGNDQVAELATAISDQSFHLVTTKGATTNNYGDVMARIGLVYGANAPGYLGNGFMRFHRATLGYGGDISFSLNNGSADQELMRLSAAGKVGIGTSAPAATLDIKGNIKVADGTQAAGKVLTSDANGLASWQALPITSATAWAVNGNNIYNNNTGNIGVAASGGLMTVGTPGWSDSAKIQAWNTGFHGPALDVYGNNSNWNGPAATFWTGGTGPTVNIDWAGKTSTNIVTFRNFGQLVGSINTDGGANFGGKVGIGTLSAPAATLDIKGNLKVADGTQAAGKVLTSDANGLASWQTPAASTSGWTVSGGYISSALGNNVIITNPNDNSAGGGNVSIGAGIYSNTKLEVKSNEAFAVWIDDPNASGDALYVNGSAAKTDGNAFWTLASDERLKTNINQYGEGLDMLMKIKPIKFHYKNGSGFNSEKEQVGVIAQQIQQVAPEMVSKFTNRQDGKEYLSVNMSPALYMLINAVKELKGKNDAKDSVITNQQQKIVTLEGKIDLVLQRLAELETAQAACCNSANSKTVLNNQDIIIDNASAARLEQNQPNPFNQSTVIKYHLPAGVNNAQMLISDLSGHTLKAVSLSPNGDGQVTLAAGTLAQGNYFYSLLVDGRRIDTKQMLMIK